MTGAEADAADRMQNAAVERSPIMPKSRTTPCVIEAPSRKMGVLVDSTIQARGLFP
jgi:hypothetical protein